MFNVPPPQEVADAALAAGFDIEALPFKVLASALPELIGVRDHPALYDALISVFTRCCVAQLSTVLVVNDQGGQGEMPVFRRTHKGGPYGINWTTCNDRWGGEYAGSGVASAL